MPKRHLLLPRVARGDRAAVTQVVETYGGLVYSIARRFTPSAEDAEDLVQEVFVELWRKADRFDPASGSEATFVATIARRRSIDRLRKTGARPSTEALSPGSEPAVRSHALPGLETSDEFARALSFLQQLRPEQRRVLRMSIQLGLTHREIAEQLGIPLGTVKTHLRRGLIRARELARASTERGHD